LEYFTPLLTFANRDLGDSDWAEALWEGMGRERLCRATTNAGELKIFASDRNASSIRESVPHIPVIAGDPASFEGVRALQRKVRLVLNRLIRTAEEIHLQRAGRSSLDRVLRAKNRDMMLKPTKRGSDYADLPWSFSHFDEHHEVIGLIRMELPLPNTRSAAVDCIGGFIQFEGEGEDAAITFAWMLAGLTETVFRKELPAVKRCLFCEHYFLHKTSKQRKFCSDSCRYDFHNKGLERQPAVPDTQRTSKE
jgi:hypothetical protein